MCAHGLLVRKFINAHVTQEVFYSLRIELVRLGVDLVWSSGISLSRPRVDPRETIFLFVFRLVISIMISRSCIFLAVLCLVIVAGVHSFPADIEQCHAGDTECIRVTAVNLLRKHSKTGYPEAGFPVLEPFALKRFDISDGRSGALSLKLNFRDLLVGGLSNVNIDRMVGFTKDPSTSKFELYGSLPKLTLRGKYTADGRILILPIQGDGNADITIIKPKFSVKFKPSLNVQKGKTYLGIDKLKILLEPEGVHIKLTNLFNGDRNLGDNLNQFLNENWRDVWNELQPSIHIAISEIIKTVALNVFKKFPYEELYLE